MADEEGELLALRQRAVPNRSYGRRKLDRVTKYLAFLGAFLGAYQGGAEIVYQAWRFWR